MRRDLLRDGVAYADGWLAHQRELREIPGMVVAVQHEDELLLSKGYGFANLEHQIPVTPDHVFRIASHSKTFTATAIMQLVEDGQVRLDDAVSSYVGWLDAPATVRQLLNHVGGLTRDGLEAMFWQLAQPFPDVEGLRAIVRDAGRVLEPNQQFKYSNIGYSLLGLVVEAASGQPYNDYVKTHIVDRLGLRNTGPEMVPDLADRLVTAYTARRPPLPRLPIQDVETRAMSAATGFYSTAADLCRYARAHYLGNEELLSDASKREMQQPYWVVEQADASYGLGFAVQTIGERRMIGHGGGFPGHSTTTLIDPRERLVVVVLNNTIGPGGLAAPLATSVVKILNHALAADEARESLPYPRERYIGRFMDLWGVTDIAAFGNTLQALNPDEDDPTARVADLEVADADSLRIARANGYGSPGESVRYERDASGGVTGVWIGGTRSLPSRMFADHLRRLESVRAAPVTPAPSPEA
jgi:CubicO group peptidase (beta-lactamase class C family)